MKKILVLLVALAVQKNFAQNVFPATGNVGIGTNSPTAKLEALNTTPGITSFRTIGVNGSILVDNVGSGENYYNATNFHEFQIGGTSKVRINSNGNVGIGTASPLFKLDVKGGGHFLVPDDKSGVGGLTIETINGTNLKIGGNSTYSWIQSHASLPLYINELGNNTIINPVYGNVGIGTITPSSKLEVMGTIKNYEQTPLGSSINSSQLINSRGGSVGENSFFNRLWLYRDSTLNNWFAARLHDGISIDVSFNTPQVDTRTWWERDPNDNIQSWGNAAETYLTINKGNVGIGTINPDAKLAVNGTIHSKEVRVDVNVPAPDYVFANDYKLKSLQEVDEYIKENSHLPEIPSAKEIEKNGLMLAEMNMSLLKKIEELTLYTIEQQKNTAKLIQLLDEQNKRLKILEEARN